MNTQLILNKFMALPENRKQEVANFIDFLLQQTKKQSPQKKAVFGSYKGVFKMSDDFNEPLEDFKDYMP
ncbi:type II toxin-antitoxin system VapB family antitoxin [Flexithrix dorotheae]|uniref:type II toxin-antitoxin system VapB family antitoxin n=1 Tax=Flexithrix dorotheae TaxID=70993 RepID=UPI00035F34EE|nr:DUF2281 domain-containing protein [Flexithrix dorotheae]